MLSSFDPENYAEIIRSDRFPFASHLKQLYHMTLDSQHEVEIVVKTEKIVTNVNYIALNKEKISIEILNDGSYSKVKFKAIDNMKDKQLNPLRIVKFFFCINIHFKR